MTIIPCISGVITDNVQNAFAVAVGRARSLEGQYRKEALEIEDITVLIDVRGDKVYIIISNELTGVFTHPRRGTIELLTHYEWQSYNGFGALLPQKSIHGVVGGWQGGKTPLTTEYIYPLVDSDNASYLVAKDADALVGEFAGNTGNYGNLYWWNGNEEEPVLLSWKGTPTRHFRLSSSTSIPGLSTQETVSPGLYEDTPYFTTFTPHVYQNGSIYLTTPRWNWPYSGSANCLVLGAMADSDSVYIVVQSDRTRAPKYVTYFSDGYRIASDVESDKQAYLSSHAGVTIAFEKEYPSQGGIYTMLWKEGGFVDGWSFVGEWNTGRRGLPWFGNKSGTEFINSFGTVIKLDGSMIFAEEGIGYKRESLIGDHPQFSFSYNGKTLYEFKEDVPINGSIELSSTIATSHAIAAYEQVVYDGTFKVVQETLPPPLLVTTDTNKTFGTGDKIEYGVAGGEMFIEGEGYRKTYSGFTVSEDLTILTSGCGMGAITVTDACGTTSTAAIRLENGYWQLDYTWTSELFNTQPCTFGLKSVEVISGDTKTVTYITTSYSTYYITKYVTCVGLNGCAGTYTVVACIPNPSYGTPYESVSGVVTGQPPADTACPTRCGDVVLVDIPCNRYNYLCRREIYKWVCP